jgi:hypothetical protein
MRGNKHFLEVNHEVESKKTLPSSKKANWIFTLKSWIDEGSYRPKSEDSC